MPIVACRACSAFINASKAKSVVIELLTRQPTMLQANTSSTKAYSQPWQVEMYVKSDTHD